MTNEEWLNGLDTDGKAEFLRKITHNCYYCGYSYAMYGHCDKVECSFKECVDIKEDWEQWLKDEHKE